MIFQESEESTRGESMIFQESEESTRGESMVLNYNLLKFRK